MSKTAISDSQVSNIWQEFSELLRLTITPPNGVYVGMSDDVYFGFNALGSTDLSKLCYDPLGYWWKSKRNPAYEREDTPALRFGKMLHAYVLEGEAEFDKRNIIPPFPEDFSKNKKEYQDWKKQAEADGLVIITREQYESLHLMAQLILNHPELGGIKSGLNEIAIFWTEDNILFRAKFDSLTPSFIIDFKTLDGENARGDTLDEKIEWVVKNGHYDVQRSHYEIAREKLREFVNAGLVFGADADQLQKLSRVAARAQWYFLWVFYQKIDNKKGKAPVVVPRYSSRNDDAHQFGFLKIQTAIKNYHGFQAKFGPTEPWGMVDRIRPMVRYHIGISYVPSSEFEETANVSADN